MQVFVAWIIHRWTWVHYGAENIGYWSFPFREEIRVASYNSCRILVQLFWPCTPSYVLHLGDALAEYGYSLADIWNPGILVPNHGPKHTTKLSRGKMVDIYGLRRNNGTQELPTTEYHADLTRMKIISVPEIVDPETNFLCQKALKANWYLQHWQRGIPLLRL